MKGVPYPRNKIMDGKNLLIPLSGSGHTVVYWIVLWNKTETNKQKVLKTVLKIVIQTVKLPKVLNSD